MSVSESSDPHDSGCYVCVSGTTGIPLKEESKQLAGKPTRDLKNDFHVSCTDFALVMDEKELMVAEDE